MTQRRFEQNYCVNCPITYTIIRNKPHGNWCYHHIKQGRYKHAAVGEYVKLFSLIPGSLVGCYDCKSI